MMPLRIDRNFGDLGAVVLESIQYRCWNTVVDVDMVVDMVVVY